LDLYEYLKKPRIKRREIDNVQLQDGERLGVMSQIDQDGKGQRHDEGQRIKPRKNFRSKYVTKRMTRND
jgi:hypothetical protein